MYSLLLFEKDQLKYPVEEKNGQSISKKRFTPGFIKANAFYMVTNENNKMLVQLNYPALERHVEYDYDTTNGIIPRKPSMIVDILTSMKTSFSAIDAFYLEFNNVDEESPENIAFGERFSTQTSEHYFKEVIAYAIGVLIEDDALNSTDNINLRIHLDTFILNIKTHGSITIHPKRNQIVNPELYIETVFSLTNDLNSPVSIKPVTLIEKEAVEHPFSQLDKVIDFLSNTQLPKEIEHAFELSRKELAKLADDHKDEKNYL